MITSTQYIKRHQLILALLFFISAFTHAQLKNDFDPRFNESVYGDFTIIANNTVSVHQTDPYDGERSNNDFELVYVDIDFNFNTFNSSSADFTKPVPRDECLTIKKVFLYWAATDFEPDPNNPTSENQPNWDFDEVKLMLPSQSSYTNLKADEVIYRGRDDNGDGIANDHFSFDPYICFKDITDLLNTQLIDNNISPFGRYQVANVESGLAKIGEHGLNIVNGVSGGWQIVFVYENPSILPLKNISIFDGYAHVVYNSANYDILIDGFQTVPSPQDVNVKILFGALEGDRSFSGDKLQILPPPTVINPIPIFQDLSTNPTDPLNEIRSPLNFFNSRITIDDNDFLDRIPASENTLGFDAGVFQLYNPSNSIIGNDQTSTTLRLASTQETYGLFLLGLSVDVFEPNLGPIEVVTQVSSTPQAPGTTIGASFIVENKGNDDAENVKIFSTLPPQVTVDFPIVGLPTGVNATFNSVTRYLEFTVENQYVTADANPIKVDFNIKIKDECYFLEENCDKRFGMQFTATYNGVKNTDPQTTTSSSSIECGVGNNEETIINVIQPTVEWQTTPESLDRAIQCNNATGLTEAQNLSPATNKCSLNPIKTSVFDEDINCPGTGTYTNTWNFTDKCGVTISDFTQKITVINTSRLVLPSNGESTVNCIADATETFTLPTVTDACGNTLTPTAAIITENPNPLTCEGTRTYTYTYADCAGNSAQWAFVYTIDTPTFTITDADGADTVNCIANADGSGIVLPNVIDACSNSLTASAPVITENPDPLTCEGTRTYTYTFTDCAGNSDEWAFVYTIDTTTFTITDADGADTVNCIANADGSGIVLPNVTDACSNSLTASAPVITENPDPLTCEGTRTYTYTFTDCAGNTDTWAFVYTIDTPTFTITDADGASTVVCIADADGSSIVLPNVTDACSNSLTASAPVITENPDPFTCEGTRTYTYTFTDCAGNTDEWAFVYTIDLTPFILPTNGLETIGNLADAVEPTPPSVTDNCGNNIIPSAPIKTDTPDCQGSIVYTFTYTDCANNTADWTYTYTIELAPFIVPDSDGTTVECIANATNPTPPTVTDANGDEITPVMTANTDPDCEGDKIYTFTYTDCAGNTGIWAYTYTIDTPTFTISDADGADTVNCIADADGSGIVLPTITDACSNSLTASAPVIVENPDPLTCEGTRTYTYTFTDCLGNSAEWAYVYTIDTPTFTIIDADGASTVACIADADGSGIVLPTATDACGNSLTASAPVITESPDPLTCEGTRTYTYTFTDCTGNTDEWAFVYTIDLTPFILPTNGLETIGNLADAVEPTPPSVTDNCGNSIIPSAPIKTDTPDCQGSVVYTFTYTDCANNTADWTYTYTIELAPFIVPDGDGTSVECIADATIPTSPTVTDANGDEITPVMTQNADPDCEGDKIYTFTYTDCAGNTGIWEYTYTIDTPTFTITDADGADIVNCIADADGSGIVLPTITDACSNSLTASAPDITENPNPLTCEGTRTYTYTFTDCAGNSDEWAFVYTIDTASFTITDADGADTVNCIADADGSGIILPNITDSCSNSLTASAPVITETPNPFTCEGTRTYTYSFTDCAGNSDEWAFVYTIDLTPFILPTNGLETIDNLDDAVEPTPPSVTDNCGNNITPSAPIKTDTPDCQGSVVYTFTYTDCANNTADWTYTYTIELAPFIVPDSDGTTVECIADASTPTPPTVTDANGGEITPVMTQNTDPDCEGDKIYTFTYTDCAGNTGIWVYTYTIDTPTFTITDADGAETVNCIADADGSGIILPIATDSCSNSLTVSAPVITENPDPLTCEGTRTYTYTFTDCAGNSDEWAYVYTIDTPTFTITDADGAETVNCIADADGSSIILPTVTDTCSSSLTISAPVVTENPDPLTCEGTRTYTYTFTDCTGNSDEWSFVYTIDLTPFILPTNSLVTIDNLEDAVEPTPPSVTDNCGNNIIPSAPTKTDTPDCQGSVVYTFTYTDCANNTADWTYTYTIELAPFTVPDGDGSSVECLADATAPIPPTVTDANGSNITPVMTANTDPVCEGDKIYTFTYTDCAGNTGIWVYSYTIDITTLPVVPTTGGSTVECITDATQPTAPVVTDACGNDITPAITESPDPVCEGDKTYTFTYTDCTGNESVYVYTYTIDVTIAPVAPVNDGSIVECIANATQPNAPQVIDACGNDIVPVITESPDPECEGDKIYTFTYSDCAGNESVYIYTYTIDVTTAPEVPANDSTTVECVAEALQPNAIVLTDVCGNTIIPVITENADPVCEGDKIYTFTFTDCAGNVSVYTFTYIIKDTTPPVLTLPQNVTAECSDNLTPLEFGEATAADNCDPNPVVTFNDEITDGVCSGTFTITRTWTATDACGNAISEDQIISTSDTTAPNFDQTALPGDVVVECDSIPNAIILTATDNCGTAIVTVEDERIDGNCPSNYVIKRSYSAIDECGVTNTHIQTITVQDSTPPVFVETLPNANIVVQCDAIPEAETLTATDICGTATVSVSDSRTNGNCPNSYILVRTWVATDACGITSSHSQNIIVQDTTPPTFVESLPSDTTVECDMVPDATSLTAIDNCGDAIVTVNDTRTDGNCPSNYTIARTWTATDECGLKTTHTQIITVQDTTAPIPASSFETVLNVSCTDIPEAPGVEFTDNCSSNVIVAFNETNSFDENVFEDYQIVRTWTVSDACANEEVYTQTLNVALDEILNTVNAQDICFDNGVINLDSFLSEDVFGGSWEIIEGNIVATITGSIFDPTNLDSVYSESFNPNTDGIQYVLRHTGFQNGCIDITDVIMIVDAKCRVLPCGEKDISISTAITPNGDNFNETFDIEGITLCGFVAEVKIFNRWGALVYESNEYTLGSEREGYAFGIFGKWNGSSTKASFGNNGKLPNGTYYYIIQLVNPNTGKLELDPITGPVYLGTK